MKAFDTNYLVRYLVRDDEKQTAHVDFVVAEESNKDHQILISNPVLIETVWVLEKVYKASKADILHALQSLQSEWLFMFESSELIKKAIERYRLGKADFSDYLIDVIAISYDAELLTFDKSLLKEK